MSHGQVSIEEIGVVVGERDEQGLDALLALLHRERGFDFSGHKRPSLVRRIRRRMSVVGITSFTDYLEYLEQSSDELSQLFNMLLINVTAFFRDPPAWHALASRLPSIVNPHEEVPIRVWSAGCSSGEEPYTLAMVLSEALGQDVFSRRVKIYATDIDEEALAHARQATYSSKSLEAIPPELIDKYFTPCGGAAFTFKKELRRDVIFGRHDLVQDAPIPRVDVLVCRNSLMYFNPETQERILQRLQFALNPTGILFLGEAEMLLAHGDLFSPIDLKLRLFSRTPPALRFREKEDAFDAAEAIGIRNAEKDARDQLCRSAFEASPVAQVAIDTSGRLLLANQRASRLFSLAPSDVGRPFHELALSYRPAELRSCIEKVRLERRSLQLREVERVLSTGEKTFLDIEVSPLLSESGVYLGTHVSFADVTPSRRLQVELRRANIELEAAHAELRSASQELVATQAELLSTNEELETTNEELQSINEELETMNEELQSTNEELQTINEELRQRGTELNDTNAFYDGVLDSLRFGVVVVDRDLRVRTWSSKMGKMWGLSAEQAVGRHISDLDVGLPVDEVATWIRACLVTQEVTARPLDGTDDRGKPFKYTVSVISLNGEHTRGGTSTWGQDGSGVVVLVEEVG